MWRRIFFIVKFDSEFWNLKMAELKGNTQPPSVIHRFPIVAHPQLAAPPTSRTRPRTRPRAPPRTSTPWLPQPASRTAPSRGGADIPASPSSRPGGNRTTRTRQDVTSGSAVPFVRDLRFIPSLASFHPSFSDASLSSCECGFPTGKSIYKLFGVIVFILPFWVRFGVNLCHQSIWCPHSNLQFGILAKVSPFLGFPETGDEFSIFISFSG
jgi:hypothetical protein